MRLSLKERDKDEDSVSENEPDLVHDRLTESERDIVLESENDSVHDGDLVSVVVGVPVQLRLLVTESDEDHVSVGGRVGVEVPVKLSVLVTESEAVSVAVGMASMTGKFATTVDGVPLPVIPKSFTRMVISSVITQLLHPPTYSTVAAI